VVVVYDGGWGGVGGEDCVCMCSVLLLLLLSCCAVQCGRCTVCLTRFLSCVSASWSCAVLRSKEGRRGGRRRSKTKPPPLLAASNSSKTNREALPNNFALCNTSHSHLARHRLGCCFAQPHS